MMKPLIFNPIQPSSPSIESTYTHLFALAESDETLPTGAFIEADFQTQGRGQRGNSWYSSRGLNLLPSILVRYPYLCPHQSFRISILTALGIIDTLQNYVPYPQNLFIKWPNDIYYNDCKIAGILIGHSIEGLYVRFSVIGIGLNVNEYSFPSILPNPTSLRLINKEEIPLKEVREELLKRLSDRLPWTEGKYWKSEILSEYCSLLYRKGTWHIYEDLKLGGEFLGKIETVSEEGFLQVRDKKGEQRSFAFKEIAYLH